MVETGRALRLFKRARTPCCPEGYTAVRGRGEEKGSRGTIEWRC